MYVAEPRRKAAAYGVGRLRSWAQAGFMQLQWCVGWMKPAVDGVRPRKRAINDIRRRNERRC